MHKERKLYKYNCIDCGVERYSFSPQAQRCEACRNKARKKAKEKWQEKNKNRINERKISRVAPPKNSLRKVMRELAEYNKEHNTLLTYGQYIAIIEKGEY